MCIFNAVPAVKEGMNTAKDLNSVLVPSGSQNSFKVLRDSMDRPLPVSLAFAPAPSSLLALVACSPLSSYPGCGHAWAHGSFFLQLLPLPSLEFIVVILGSFQIPLGHSVLPLRWLRDESSVLLG